MFEWVTAMYSSWIQHRGPLPASIQPNDRIRRGGAKRQATSHVIPVRARIGETSKVVTKGLRRLVFAVIGTPPPAVTGRSFHQLRKENGRFHKSSHIHAEQTVSNTLERALVCRLCAREHRR